MSKRRKLPAPPLVLSPYLVRGFESEELCERMLALGTFLQKHSLLTDGGLKNLELQWRGRNGFLTISSQDVRGYAQALVQELWSSPVETWTTKKSEYFASYDKGKPRRPNHLQRLYLEWSRDKGWRGLLRVASEQPALWELLGGAVSKLNSDHQERPLLELALLARRDRAAWRRAWESGGVTREELLELAPLLPWSVSERLELFQELQDEVTDSSLLYFLIEGCRVSPRQASLLSPLPELEDAAVRVLKSLPKTHHSAAFLCGFRSFLRSQELLEKLLESFDPRDPLLRVRYGARPGKSWLEGMKEELEALIALRSGCSSR